MATPVSVPTSCRQGSSSPHIPRAVTLPPHEKWSHAQLVRKSQASALPALTGGRAEKPWSWTQPGREAPHICPLFGFPEASAAIPPGGRPLPGHWAAERLVEAHSEGVPGTQQVEAGGSSCARSGGGRGLGTRPCVLPAAAEASCRAGLFRRYLPSSSHLPSSRNFLPFPPTRSAHILS